jgi:hypothetical protein
MFPKTDIACIEHGLVDCYTCRNPVLPNLSCKPHNIWNCRECYPRSAHPQTRRCTSEAPNDGGQCQIDGPDGVHKGDHAREIGTINELRWPQEPYRSGSNKTLLIAFAGIGEVLCNKIGYGCNTYCGSCAVVDNGPVVGSGAPRSWPDDVEFMKRCAAAARQSRDAKTYESVDHPLHYGSGADDPYEHIKVVNAWGLNYQLGNATKYIARCGKKPGVNPIEELEKAKWYIQAEINRRKAEKP